MKPCITPELFATALPLAKEFIRFVNISVTPFHCVQYVSHQLCQHGYIRIREGNVGECTTMPLKISTTSAKHDFLHSTLPSLAPGMKIFLTRNDSSIHILRLGKFYRPGNAVKIIGAHTDSPDLQLKPIGSNCSTFFDATYGESSKKGGCEEKPQVADSGSFSVKQRQESAKDTSLTVKNGCLTVNIQCYGGGLWYTWFDRDLTLAGRVFYRYKLSSLASPHGEDIDKKSNGKERTILVKKLVNFAAAREGPLLCIPSLCIHLCAANEREAFTFNKQSHLLPIIATELAAHCLSRGGGKGPISSSSTAAVDSSASHSFLLDALAKELGCCPHDIIDFDLHLFDHNKAALGGLCEEFIHSARQDNLVSCFCALKALLELEETSSSVEKSEGFESDDCATLISLFDNEEVGSASVAGAGSEIVNEILDYLCNGDPTLRSKCVSRSFVLSVDSAHALHPNYSEKHDENHKPLLHCGPVIKTNANQRYASNGQTQAMLKSMCMDYGVPFQSFVIRNDSACGTTIGPLISTNTGIKTVDVGNGMLSMHSIRETSSTVDLLHLKNLLTTFIKVYRNESGIVGRAQKGGKEDEFEGCKAGGEFQVMDGIDWGDN